jgi:kynurenine formamidase
MKKIVLEYDTIKLTSDLSAGIDISIPLDFYGNQPNTYGVPYASAQAFQAGEFIGDVRKGGSCNFEVYSFIPHCNGTHTEGIGHLTAERVQVPLLFKPLLVPAVLITLTPVSGMNTHETYTPNPNPEDWIITLSSLQSALERILPECEALIIRTLPNPLEKKYWNYAEKPSPYFSHEAMQSLSNTGLKHLLVDFPSIDRLWDEGLLSNHRIWFQLPEKGHETPLQISQRTITEMVYITEEAEDGNYLLSLQTASFIADATPSRPVIFPVHSITPAEP